MPSENCKGCVGTNCKVCRGTRQKTAKGGAASVGLIPVGRKNKGWAGPPLISRATLQPADRALHLHRHKLPRIPHHAVITARVSPRLAHRQPLLPRPRHKHRLRPLPALFLVLDNLRFPLLHSLYSSTSVIPTKLEDWQPANPPARGGTLCFPSGQSDRNATTFANTALCSRWNLLRSRRQENGRKKWEGFPKRECKRPTRSIGP